MCGLKREISKDFGRRFLEYRGGGLIGAMVFKTYVTLFKIDQGHVFFDLCNLFDNGNTFTFVGALLIFEHTFSKLVALFEIVVTFIVVLVHFCNQSRTFSLIRQAF